MIDAVPVLHVSFAGPPNEEGIAYPAILPMIGCMSGKEEETGSDRPSLYLHGYVSSRFMKQGGGTPVCVAATIMDGLVLALTPNHHSCNYRSAVVFGRAYLVTDDAEKTYAMQRITDNMLPTRWENSRVPPTKTEMTSTGILRVEIDSASAKTRSGGPGEDRNDLKDEALRERVWTGVVPMTVQWGKPVAAEGNRVKEVPKYVEEWRTAQNADAEEYARKAAE